MDVTSAPPLTAVTTAPLREATRSQANTARREAGVGPGVPDRVAAERSRQQDVAHISEEARQRAAMTQSLAADAVGTTLGLGKAAAPKETPSEIYARLGRAHQARPRVPPPP